METFKTADEFINSAREDVCYTLISYKSPILETWTIPQPIQGVGEEVERNFIVSTRRACLLGQCRKENIGMMAYVVGYFADGTGKIEVLDEPKFLCELTIPSSTPALEGDKAHA